MKKHRFDGAFLKTLRKRNGMTLEELGEEIGTSKSYMHELENGKCEPSFHKAYALAKVLGVEMKLFGREAEKDRII